MIRLFTIFSGVGKILELHGLEQLVNKKTAEATSR